MKNNLHNRMKVIIYPHVDPYYSGFYIYGLHLLYGKQNVHYSAKEFKDIPLDDVWNVYMAFIVEDENGHRTKYVIDSNDYNTVKQKMYDWCDVYGHCNANFSRYSKADYPKLVVLCPSFGIRCWSGWETAYYCITNICKLHFHAVPSVKRLIGRYYKQLKRSWYDEYLKSEPVRENYIFSHNTLWYNNGACNNDAGLNKIRTVFIDACRDSEGITFEGGLVPRKRSKNQVHKFLNYLAKPISHREYLQKEKQSMLVFNTPAFWDCHGWKLGEYLALGKCIVSTPLSNELPPVDNASELFYFIEPNYDSMRDAISYLQQHPETRTTLEKNVLSYWHKNGDPIASLKRLGL